MRAPRLPRLGYRVGEVVALTGLSRSVVEREIQRQRVGRKTVGGCVLLDPRDVERVFGFEGQDAAIRPGPRALALVAKLKV